MDCDKGPVEENEEKVETSSFMPEKLIQICLGCNVQGKGMDIGSVPFNEFSTQNLGALGFPSLFPYGQGYPTINQTIRDTSSKET